MIGAQRQLQVEVENLEAKHKLVQVAEASSDFQFDDSQLARCKELMTDIRTRLDVAAKLANADTNFQEEIPLEEAESEDVSAASRRVLRPRFARRARPTRLTTSKSPRRATRTSRGQRSAISGQPERILPPSSG